MMGDHRSGCAVTHRLHANLFVQPQLRTSCSEFRLSVESLPNFVYDFKILVVFPKLEQ